jgi:hypothetical protein
LKKKGLARPMRGSPINCKRNRDFYPSKWIRPGNFRNARVFLFLYDREFWPGIPFNLVEIGYMKAKSFNYLIKNIKTWYFFIKKLLHNKVFTPDSLRSSDEYFIKENLKTLLLSVERFLILTLETCIYDWEEKSTVNIFVHDFLFDCVLCFFLKRDSTFLSLRSREKRGRARLKVSFSWWSSKKFNFYKRN